MSEIGKLITYASQNPIIFDTETTSLHGEVIEVAAVDLDGNVLLNSYCKPVTKITTGAYQVHGISEQMVADAPLFYELWDAHIMPLLQLGRPLLSYNMAFDFRMVRNSYHSYGQAFGPLPSPTACIMEAYAVHWGVWRNRRGYVWQSLVNACRQQNVVIEEKAHSALGDTLRALEILKILMEAHKINVG